tara:strand:+ start:78 stop:359 length:282 start_codon:yes stop_codon:yes gene_type:complete
MNNRREEQRREDDQAMAARVADLQEELDQTVMELGEARDRIAELETQLTSAPTAAPAGDDALRGLANTYRTAVRNGHPDAVKHLEALLAMIGA